MWLLIGSGAVFEHLEYNEGSVTKPKGRTGIR